MEMGMEGGESAAAAGRAAGEKHAAPLAWEMRASTLHLDTHLCFGCTVSNQRSLWCVWDGRASGARSPRAPPAKKGSRDKQWTACAQPALCRFFSFVCWEPLQETGRVCVRVRVGSIATTPPTNPTHPPAMSGEASLAPMVDGERCGEIGGVYVFCFLRSLLHLL
jgi:hypothetical protein